MNSDLEQAARRVLELAGNMGMVYPSHPAIQALRTALPKDAPPAVTREEVETLQWMLGPMPRRTANRICRSWLDLEHDNRAFHGRQDVLVGEIEKLRIVAKAAQEWHWRPGTTHDLHCNLCVTEPNWRISYPITSPLTNGKRNTK